jgi:hypothetical protein
MHVGGGECDWSPGHVYGPQPQAIGKAWIARQEEGLGSGHMSDILSLQPPPPPTTLLSFPLHLPWTIFPPFYYIGVCICTRVVCTSLVLYTGSAIGLGIMFLMYRGQYLKRYSIISITLRHVFAVSHNA